MKRKEKIIVLEVNDTGNKRNQYLPGALNDCFKAGAGRKTTSEANDRNRFEIPSLHGLDFARPVYFPFFQLAEPEMAVSIHVHNLESRSHC